ncbi:glyoxalase [Halalkalibacillus sediminis]|uniref:Glyoxalase n=1 Tax=Halalkalibacillus sediminis TaxID=2018042 RepID=A0A2I0QQV3_9BACI|nr:VOC family protein [Halalkalibacillus sediminis]PKR76717.1 glyoxalase [Halalkalibacillus sediminis]
MSYSLTKIDHVQLSAPPNSEDKARDFFINVLGMEEVEKPTALKKNGGVWFQTDGVQLHVGIEEDFTPNKKAHPALEVLGLEALMSQLDLHRVPYQKDNKIPGANRIYIHDPFGNRIEMIQWV